MRESNRPNSRSLLKAAKVEGGVLNGVAVEPKTEGWSRSPQPAWLFEGALLENSSLDSVSISTPQSGRSCRLAFGRNLTRREMRNGAVPLEEADRLEHRFPSCRLMAISGDV